MSRAIRAIGRYDRANLYVFTGNSPDPSVTLRRPLARQLTAFVD